MGGKQSKAKSSDGGGSGGGGARGGGRRDLGDREGEVKVVDGSKKERQLIEAARAGDLSTLRKLTRGGVDVDFGRTLSNVGSAVVEAARCGSSEAVGILLDAGADVGVTDGSKATALHYAARKKDFDMIQRIVQHPTCTPAIVNLRDSGGRTALHFVAQRGEKELCAVLIAAGADPTIKDNRGKSATDVAKGGAKEILSESA